MKIELDHIYNMDCLEGMKCIPDGSVDAVICDLPYGTTACAWDSVIPFAPLWEQYRRICKPNAAVVLFGREPFSTQIRMSNIKEYRYDWVWVKSQGVNFVQVNKMPLQKHELISVFIKAGNGRIYNPQGIRKCHRRKSNGNGKFGSIVSDKGHAESYLQETENYPESLLYFDNEHNHLHPTQKPVDLIRYLVLTYTNSGGGSSGQLHGQRHNSHRVLEGKTSLHRLRAEQRLLRHRPASNRRRAQATDIGL